MLTIKINEDEFWDEDRNIFIPIHATEFHFEHSLLAISKWEEKWQIPYLDDTTPKTKAQEDDYLRCMCSEEISDEHLLVLNGYHGDELKNYIKNKMTATWFDDSNTRHKKSIVTNEIVYYWMFSNGIPKECETWNFNKLMTLIRVFSEKNGPEKKMSMKDRYAYQKSLNAARRAKSGSRG